MVKTVEILTRLVLRFSKPASCIGPNARNPIASLRMLTPPRAETGRPETYGDWRTGVKALGKSARQTVRIVCMILGLALMTGLAAGVQAQNAPGPSAQSAAPAPLLPPATEPPHMTQAATTAWAEGASDTNRAAAFLRDGGPSIWAIAVLSVLTVALILWKTWRLALIGAWARGKAFRAVATWESGDAGAALAIVQGRRGLRSRVVAAAITARQTRPEAAAREETTRVAKHELAEAATGLRALELIATIAPLLGLLGTVLGMIAAFQALQQSGARADPAMLAGGIWEALLTTAAGMAVAIPASAALTWFEAVIDRMRRDVEDAAVRIFVSQPDTAPPQEPLAAE